MKMQRYAFILFFPVVLFFLSTLLAQSAGLEADMVIHNGKILTADSPDPDNFTIAQAAAVYDGKFVVVGSDEEALALAGPNTRKIDLEGRTVLPGLIDTHSHIYSYGTHFFPRGIRIDHGGQSELPIVWTNKEDFLRQIQARALKKKPGEWIITWPSGGIGGGNTVVELQRGEVTRFDLDEVTPDNPVFVEWTEEGLVNTKALEPLLERYPAIKGVRRDLQGIPTGRLSGEAAKALKYDFYPQINLEELGPYYRLEMEEFAAQGVTTISSRMNPRHLAAYSWLNARGEMPLRIAYSSEAAALNPNPDATLGRLLGLQGGAGENMWGAGDDKLWMIGLAATFQIDGQPSLATACMSKPYPRESLNFPLWQFQFWGPYGICRLDSPDFRDPEIFRAAAKYGFRTTAMHTAGDRAVEQYLDLVEELSQDYPDIVERRWAIDHCRYLTDEHAARAKKLGLFFACGPKYVYGGARSDIGAYKEIFGENVASDSVVPLRRLLDHGLRATIHLDQHGFYSFLALEVAVTRKDVTGKVWGPQQRVSRREALYMLSRWSSEYVLREDFLGSIEPKKAADFVVLNRDYLTVPEDEIAMIDPVLTVMGGEITYTQPEFATNTGLPQVGFRGNPTWWKRGTPQEAQEALRATAP